MSQLRVIKQLRQKSAKCAGEGTVYAKCVVSQAETMTQGACAREFAEFYKCFSKK